MASDYDISSLIEDSVSPLRANDIDPNEAIKDPDKVVQMLQDRQYGPTSDKLPTLNDTGKSTGQGTGSYTPSVSEVPMATAGNQPAQPTEWASLMNGASAPASSSASSAAGSTVSNGQPAEDPDLVNARNLAQKSQQRTDQIQANYDANAKRIQDLETQRAQKATPIDPKGTSAATGKSYNPSVGRRILRGVLGGVEGFAKGGFNGALLGAVDPKAVTGTAYGAPTAQYGRDVAKQQGELSSLDQQIKTTEQQQKDQYEAGRSLGTDTNANARVFADIATTKRNADNEANAKREADRKQQHEDATENNNNRRADIADRNATTQARRTDAIIARLARTGGDAQGNPDARQAIINAGNNEVQSITDRYTKYDSADGGKWFDENLNSISHAQYQDLKQKALDKTNKALIAKHLPPIQGKFSPTDGVPAYDSMGRPVPGASARPQQTAAPAQNNQPNKAGVTVGQSVVVNGQNYVVKSINPQTGKPVLGR